MDGRLEVRSERGFTAFTLALRAVNGRPALRSRAPA
jgi:hypothetical protein